MLLSVFIRRTAASLEPLYGIQEAKALSLLLCMSLLGVKSYTHIIEPSTEIPPEKQAPLDSAAGRLVRGEPLQYVLGYCEFCGRKFRVNPSVLIPRPETEMLVREAEKTGVAQRGLDLCCGSGCIGWSLLLDGACREMTCVDISEEALETAKGQFPSEKRNISFIKDDVLGGLDQIGGRFELIVSNPPYIKEKEKVLMRKNVLDYEPHIALFVPDNDPLVFYKAIARHSRKLLSASGCGIVETNEDLGEETAGIFREQDFSSIEIINDICGKQRFVKYRF